MIVTSQLLDTFDRCPRRYAFEREYQPTTISTLGLLYAAVEASVAASDPRQAAADAITDLTQRLDVNAGELSPLSVIRHVESMSAIIALAMRAKFGKMRHVDPVSFGEHQWRSNLFEAHGNAHRIILAGHMDDDSLRSFAHSWGTVGELAALERPLTLTIVIIGSQRGGRRHSAWAKGFQHPIQKVIRFGQRKKADGFTTGWKEVWREQSNIKPETWLERMGTDGVLDELIVSRKVAYREDDERMLAARREMMALIPRMEASTQEEPMRRSSCDSVFGACPYQAVCYSATPVGPENLPGLYRRRETPLVAIAG